MRLFAHAAAIMLLARPVQYQYDGRLKKVARGTRRSVMSSSQDSFISPIVMVLLVIFGLVALVGTAGRDTSVYGAEPLSSNIQHVAYISTHVG